MAVATLKPADRKSLEPWISDSTQYYPHQIKEIRELSRRKSFLLADEMGLGKSLVALTVFTVDVARDWAKTCLIVCPVTLKGNWADELEKFTTFPYKTLNGTPLQRREQFTEFTSIQGPKVLIVNYEQIAAHWNLINDFAFDVAIFDEAHYLKNPKAKRTKACLTLYSRRSFLLTGTPLLNHVNELWSLLHRIDPDAYPKYWSFLNRYAVFGGWKDKQIIGVKNEKELTERLQNIMIRNLKKDVLDLPEVQYIERRVDLLPEQLKIYNEVKDELRLPRADSATPDDIENALTKFLRLKQICGTTLPFTGEDISGKLDLAVSDAYELIENGNRIVVFTQFRAVQEAFCKRLSELDVPIWQLHGDIKQDRRQPIVKEWGMSKEPGALVAMIQVAGVGLNMVQSKHALFLDKLFVPGLNLQAVDRLHRIGSSKTQPVQVFEYLTRNTIESRVNQILRVKSKLFGEIVETDADWKKKLYQSLISED